jgi:hypothetical protein
MNDIEYRHVLEFDLFLLGELGDSFVLLLHRLEFFLLLLL